MVPGRQECHGTDIVVMTAHCTDAFVAFEIPELDCHIRGTRRQQLEQMTTLENPFKGQNTRFLMTVL